MRGDRINIEHPVINTIEKLYDFYESLSDTASSFPISGITNVINIDTLIFMAIQTTFDSIYHLLKKGKLNDAWSLLRKYFDVVEMNIYSIIHLDQENEKSLREDDHDKSLIDKTIDDWIEGNKKLPRRLRILKYIFKAEKLKNMNPIFFKLEQDNNKYKVVYIDKYKDIRERCDDNLHYKHFHFLKLNFLEFHRDKKDNVYDIFFQDIISIFTLHIAYVFFIKYYYMMASDYVDALDMGMQPEEGSQYWVASIVQDIFDDIVKKENLQVYEFIKENTCMKLK